MTGKVCVITGATSGIGLATAQALAAQGATVLLLGRDAAKGQAAVRQVQAESPQGQALFFQTDLALQSSIRQTAQAVLDQFPVIDVLINNAGIWALKRELTAEGIELTFAVNHLAYFLLTHLLYPALRRAPEARVINVSSRNQFDTHIHFDDLQLERHYTGFRAYAQSKLANVLFTYELHRRKPDAHVTANVLHPGLVHTDIGLKHTNWLYALGWRVRRTFWPSLTPAEGAKTSVFLASSPEVKGQSGLYWVNSKATPSAKDSYNEADARRLWEISEQWCGIRSYFPG